MRQAGFYLGREHGLARIDRVDFKRQFQIGKRHRAQGRRNELFAAHIEQRLQHVGVQNIPGADLLFHHVEAGLFYVGQGRSVHDGQKKQRNQLTIVPIRSVL
ncbi:hypothetical protein D9M69_614380 [compost metagenome]